MNTKADLGIEELDEFGPSPSFLSDINAFLKSFFAMFSFMG